MLLLVVVVGHGCRGRERVRGERRNLLVQKKNCVFFHSKVNRIMISSRFFFKMEKPYKKDRYGVGFCDKCHKKKKKNNNNFEEEKTNGFQRKFSFLLFVFKPKEKHKKGKNSEFFSLFSFHLSSFISLLLLLILFLVLAGSLLSPFPLLSSLLLFLGLLLLLLLGWLAIVV